MAFLQDLLTNRPKGKDLLNMLLQIAQGPPKKLDSPLASPGFTGQTATPTATPITTPAPTAMPTPSPTPTAMPTMTPKEPSGLLGKLTPTPTPTLIPWQTRELPYEERPYHQDIVDIWGDKTNIAHDILRYIEEETGDVKGENVPYDSQKDTFNRTNPETGKYDETMPIDIFTNPITGKEEQSIDRGLFRINNKTFYDYQTRYPEFFKENDINSWDDMLDVLKNIKLAKFIFDQQGKAWYGANPSTGARID